MLLKYIFLLTYLMLTATEANHGTCGTTDAIRIKATGSSPHEGIMQICVSGYWHSVCRYSWNCPEAKVACKQLGYTGYITHSPYCCWSYSISDSTPKDNRTWHCSGHETSLTSCVHSFTDVTSSTCSYSARISCKEHDFGPPNCTERDVRLMDGAVSNEGRVEVCYHGIWSSLCNIDQYVATTICKQLGYTEYASILPSHYGHSASNLYSMSCSYDVNHLNECTTYYDNYFHCSYGIYLQQCSAAIRCYSQNISTACIDGSVRLVDGDIAQEGTLEICAGGVWGIICRSGWSTIDSLVACKQMGYDFGTNLHLNQYYLSIHQWINGTNKPYLYSNVNCQGFEATLSHCSKLSYPHFTCYHYYNYYYYYWYYYNIEYDRGVRIRCLDECNNGDIRITGGPIETEGTVEICRNHLWGLVSDQDWGSNEARVVCRQLGFQTHDVHAVHYSYYGRPDKTVHYSNVNCTGAEDKLVQCGKTALSLTAGKTTYKTVDAAGVSCHGPPTTDPPCIPPFSATPSPPVCINGQIQLTDGQTPAEGILEYCYNGRWSHFCILQPQEATVACIELGYTQYTKAAVFTDAEFGSNNHSYSHFQNMSCSSSVLDLSYCVINEADCLPSCVPIGIRCYEPGGCEEGSVRLIDGVIEQEGRVEVCSNGVWGSVCDQNWDKTDAHIICQQMGHPELEPIAFHNSYFGDGHGPIVYSNVSCGGWEQRITDCTKATNPSFSCSREQTAGVLCGEHCNDGDIRLVGGASKYEGTVEICFGNLWGLIGETGWGDNDAQVVCRQLQYDSKDAVSYVNSHFGKPNKTIQASSITCFGDEQTLTECTMTTYELETGKALLELIDVVGVSCTPNFCLENPTITPACSISDSIRLTGGDASYEGRLEYCYDGKWTAACSTGLSEATVACRQLGYTEYAWATIVAYEASDPSTNVSYFVNSTCTGTELDTTECSRNKICSSCNSNKIICYEGSNPCDEGSARLAGGTANKNGRVEVCYNGVWGTVCEDGWSLSDAIVVCKQLGLTREGVIAYAVTNSSIFGQSNLPVVYSDVSCAGWESHLLECSRKHHSTFECSSSNTAGVICSDACSNGDVRLVGGAVETEGTVEICSRSVWGVISATKWTAIDAAVVCNQLRYPSGEAEAVVNSRSDVLSSFVHLTNVQCNGTENTVFNCSADLTAEGSSNNGDNIGVAGVLCRNSPTSSTVMVTPTNAKIDPTNTVIAPVLIVDKGSELPLAVLVGILSVVTIIGGIVITLLVVVMRRTKKRVEKESESNNDGGALLKDNPLFGVNDDSNY